MNVWILGIYHKHGSDLSAFDNDEKARESLYEYVKDYWDDRDGPIPTDPGEAISEYFLHSEYEGYEITETLVL